MNALELFILGRTLMKIGEDAVPAGGGRRFATSVWSILADVIEHPNSSIGEITARTGFPQSHVSASVARLRAVTGALETAVDPHDRRRTLVRVVPEAYDRFGPQAPTQVDGALAAALGTRDPQEIGEIVATLEALARRLTPRALTRVRAELPPD